MRDSIKRPAMRVVLATVARVSPPRWKRFRELRYWKGRKRVEDALSNDHFEYFYTTHFGLDSSYYDDKVVLDVGCGPRGSLEWASSASRRLGLDPLANDYLELGASEHEMEYLDAPAEEIPLADGACDVVSSFNSLDHVEDVGRALSEVKRVLRPGGVFLLLVEVNHSPTDCEPHELTPAQLIGSLKPEMVCENLQVYRPTGGRLWDAIRAGDTVEDPERTTEAGYMSARFVRNPSGEVEA